MTRALTLMLLIACGGADTDGDTDADTDTDTAANNPCDPGYAPDASGACVNVDECAEALDDCPLSSTCSDTEGAFTCECPTGYTGDGYACEDIDECSDSNPCGPNSTCFNVPGEHVCDCLPGFDEVDGQCAAVDACSSVSCAANQVCINHGSGGTCIDLPRDCWEAMESVSGAISGHYTIDPDGTGGLDPVLAYCDMDTDGGGWTLVLNYVHQANTNPDRVVLSDRLPAYAGDAFAVAQHGTEAWGHAAPALVSQLEPTEIRMDGVEQGTAVHGVFVNPRTLRYATTGEGAWAATGDAAPRSLAGDTSLAGDFVTVSATDGGDMALTTALEVDDQAVWRAGDGGWSIDTVVDDAQDTIHRIWVRRRCQDGFEYDPLIETCRDIHECDDYPALCTEGCVDEVGAYTCGECTSGEQAWGGVCEDIDVCATGALACLPTETCIDQPSSGMCARPASCKQLRDVAAPEVLPDGVYTLWLADEPYQAWCDMTREGGGWTLVLNYDRTGGAVEPTVARHDRLLAPSSADLPLNGASFASFWGHAAPGLVGQLAPTEMFFDVSYPTQPNRHTSFILTNPGCLDYFSTGVGACNPGSDWSWTSVNNDSVLPLDAVAGLVDQGEDALVRLPFQNDLGAQWNLGADSGATWNTDFDLGNVDRTIRTWVR